MTTQGGNTPPTGHDHLASTTEDTMVTLGTMVMVMTHGGWYTPLCTQSPHHLTPLSLIIRPLFWISRSPRTARVAVVCAPVDLARSRPSEDGS